MEEEQPDPVLPSHLLAALATTMGEEEVVEAELLGVPQRQLGVKVDSRGETVYNCSSYLQSLFVLIFCKGN